MTDLNVEMAELWGALGAPAPGRPRVIQVAAARRGEGTSTVARELAFFAARRAGRSVWLVDLDLVRQDQFAAVALEPQRYGELGDAVAASPDGSAFFTVQPPSRGADGIPWPDSRYLAAHRVGSARWWVTRFRREALKGRQQAHLIQTGDYWQALRRYADLVIVDAPAADRSQAAQTTAPFMDETILVVSADEADTRPPARLRDDIVSAGGRVAGIFYNRAEVEAPGFLRAILP